MDNQFQVILQTILSQNGIQKSLQDIQKTFNSNPISLMTKMDSKSTLNDVKKISNEIATELNKSFNLNLSGKDVVNVYKQMQTEANRVAKANQTVAASEKEISGAIAKVTNYMVKNTAMDKAAKTQMQGFITTLKSGDVSKKWISQMNADLATTDARLRSAGKLGLSFFDRMKQGMSKFSMWFGSTALIMKSIQSVKSMWNSVIDLDTALVDLKKTTNATASELEDFYYSSNDTAKQLGQTTEAVISATSAWSRLGYAIDDAKTMAENSSIFASISPEMDIDTATDGLVSMMKAFDIDAGDSLDGIISKVNSVGNSFAVSNDMIVEAMENSSAAMASANNSLEQTIALNTASTEITQNASITSNALRTMSMRIRGYDEETENYSEDLENLSGTIADLTKTASTPGGISLFTDDTKETYKSTYDLLKEISVIYDDLSDKNQASLLEALAGKRSAQSVAALISNFDQAEAAMSTMSNSAGNAMNEMEIIYDSAEYKLNRLKETGVGISQNLFDSGAVKGSIDILNGVLEVVDKLTSALGSIGTIGLGAGLFAGIKNLGTIKTWYNDLKNAQSVINSISNVHVFANGATGLLNTASLTAMTTAVSGLSKEQALLVLSTKNLTNAQKEQVLVSAGIIATDNKISASVLSQALAKSTLSATEKESLMTKLGLIDATTGEAVANATCTKEALLKALATKGVIGADAEAIISSIGLTTANGAQSVSFDVLTASIWANIKAIGTWLVTNPVGWCIIAAGAIFGVVKAYDALTDSVEETKEKSDSLLDSYNSAITKANENAKSVESIASRYEELSKGVNNLGEKVSLTTDEYSEYNDIVNQIADMFPTLISGYTDEGNAILSLKGNVNELRDAYKEAQQEAYNMLITSGEDSDGNDIIKNWDNLHETGFFAKLFDFGADDVGGGTSTVDAIKQLKEFQNMTAETYREIERITSFGSRKEIKGLTDIQKDIGFGSYLYKALGIDEHSTDQEIANAKKQAQVLVQTYNAGVQSALNDVETLANAYLMTNDDYSKLSDQSKNAASLIVNSLNEDIANGFSSKEDVGAYVAEIVSMIKDNPDMNDALVGLFALDKELSPAKMKEQVDDYINKIAEWLGEDPVELKVRLGFNGTDDLATEYENAINKFTHGANNPYLSKFFEDNSINDQEEIDYWNSVTEGAKNAKEAVKKYNDAKNAAIDYSPSDIFSLKDSSNNDTDLGKLNSQVDQIQQAYQTLYDIQEGYSENKSIDIDQLQSLLSLGDDFLDYLVDEDGNLKTDTESMKELTKARLFEMEAKVQQGLIDNVTAIQSEKDANIFLASTNYELAASYRTLNEAALDSWKSRALVNGMSQDTINSVMSKYNANSKKVSDLFLKAITGVDTDINNSLSSSSTSSKSPSKSESEKIINFAEERLNELNDLIDITKKNIEQLEGSASKNTIIDSLIDVDNSKLSTLQSVHDLYEDMANQYLAKIPDKYKELAINGGIEIDKFIGDSDVTDAIDNYKSWADKIDDVNSEMLELKQTLKDLQVDKFNNIKQDFEDMYDIIDKNKSKINDVINLLESQGQNVGKGFYEELISETQTQINNLTEERQRLSTQMSNALTSGIEYGSDEWKEMYDSLQDVDSSIISCKKDMVDFQKSIEQLHWDNLKKLENQFSSINDEIENLNGLLENDTVSNNGKFTSEAITQIGLLAQQYELARTEVSQYADEIDYLNQEYKNGSISINDYNDKLNELQNAQWESISLSESAKDSILDLAKARTNETIEAINEETDAYEELIDKQKKSLDAEKNLYEYKKSIAEKEKSISALKRRINAMIGSDDASTIAEREKLEAELAELTNDLEDYKYNHSIEVRQDALDKELEDFQKSQDDRINILENSLKDEKSILQSAINEAKLRANEIANVLTKLEREQGITINSCIINPWKTGSNAIAGYNQTLNSSTSNFISRLISVKNNIINVQSQADRMASSIMSAFNISNTNVNTAISSVRSWLNDAAGCATKLKLNIDDALNKNYGSGVVKTIKNVKDIIDSVNASLESIGNGKHAYTVVYDYGTGREIALSGVVDKATANKIAQDMPGSRIKQVYSKGGVVSANGKYDEFARSVGEDVSIYAKEGERILSTDQTKSFDELVKDLPVVMPNLTNLANSIKMPNFDFNNIGKPNNTTPVINIDAGITVQGNVDKDFAKEFENLQDRLTKNVTSKIANSLEKLGVQKNNCRPL